jgi:hypothetical protein
MAVSYLKRLKSLEAENRCPKQIVAGQALDNLALKEFTLKKLLMPEVKHLVASHVRESLKLSLRKACLPGNLSTYVYYYRPKPDNGGVLRHRLPEPAAQRKRFSSPPFTRNAEKRNPGIQSRADRTIIWKKRWH